MQMVQNDRVIADVGTARRPRRMLRWVLAAAGGLVLVSGVALVVFVAIGGLDDPRATAPEVGVTDVTIRVDAFGPPVIRVERGATVTWAFDDDGEEHNVVSEEEDWGVTEPRSTGAFEQTFDRIGTYDYQCTLHFGMTGRVEVVDATSGS